MVPAPASPARIYVRLPSWVGDVVMCTPALRALRAAHPEAELVVEGDGRLRLTDPRGRRTIYRRR